MTPRQTELVQESWRRVEPIADTAARLFYRRLFEIAPEVRPLFKTSMSEQGDKLMKSLAVVVAGLDRLDSIVPAVETLGRRHDDYGALPEHYDAVGEALLWTLEQGLGEAFTDETRAAWAEAYETLASVMINASGVDVGGRRARAGGGLSRRGRRLNKVSPCRRRIVDARWGRAFAA